jgi:hypothetical protein
MAYSVGEKILRKSKQYLELSGTFAELFRRREIVARRHFGIETKLWSDQPAKEEYRNLCRRIRDITDQLLLRRREPR